MWISAVVKLTPSLQILIDQALKVGLDIWFKVDHGLDQIRFDLNSSSSLDVTSSCTRQFEVRFGPALAWARVGPNHFNGLPRLVETIQDLIVFFFKDTWSIKHQKWKIRKHRLKQKPKKKDLAFINKHP